MHQPDQSFDGLIQPLAGDGQTSDTDVELAFQLQHGRSGDAQIQRLLVDRFAAELHRLVSGWIELDCGLSVAPGVVRGLLIEILRAATAQIEQFRGEESVRNWIYRLAVRQLKSIEEVNSTAGIHSRLQKMQPSSRCTSYPAHTAPYSGCAMG